MFVYIQITKKITQRTQALQVKVVAALLDFGCTLSVEFGGFDGSQAIGTTCILEFFNIPPQVGIDVNYS